MKVNIILLTILVLSGCALQEMFKPVGEQVQNVDGTSFVYANNQLYAGIQDTLSYYHHDIIGSIIATSDALGEVQQTTEFMPFGVPTQPVMNTYAFTAKKFDYDTSTYYFGARYYYPLRGRFLSVDPADQLPNPYTYTKNNPIRFIDPTGKQSLPSTHHVPVVREGTLGRAGLSTSQFRGVSYLPDTNPEANEKLKQHLQQMMRQKYGGKGTANTLERNQLLSSMLEQSFNDAGLAMFMYAPIFNIGQHDPNVQAFTRLMANLGFRKINILGAEGFQEASTPKHGTLVSIGGQELLKKIWIDVYQVAFNQLDATALGPELTGELLTLYMQKRVYEEIIAYNEEKLILDFGLFTMTNQMRQRSIDYYQPKLDEITVKFEMLATRYRQLTQNK